MPRGRGDGGKFSPGGTPITGPSGFGGGGDFARGWSFAELFARAFARWTFLGGGWFDIDGRGGRRVVPQRRGRVRTRVPQVPRLPEIRPPGIPDWCWRFPEHPECRRRATARTGTAAQPGTGWPGSAGDANRTAAQGRRQGETLGDWGVAIPELPEVVVTAPRIPKLPEVIVRGTLIDPHERARRALEEHCLRHPEECAQPGDPRFDPNVPESELDFPQPVEPVPGTITAEHARILQEHPELLQFASSSVERGFLPPPSIPAIIWTIISRTAPIWGRLILREPAKKPATPPQRAPQPIPTVDPRELPTYENFPDAIPREMPELEVKVDRKTRTLPQTPLEIPTQQPVTVPQPGPLRLPQPAPLPSPSPSTQPSPRPSPSPSPRTSPSRSPSPLPGSRPSPWPFPSAVPFLPLALPLSAPGRPSLSPRTSPTRPRLTRSQDPGVQSFAQPTSRPKDCPPCGQTRERQAEKRKKTRRECVRSVTRNKLTGQFARRR